jgi:hypothetical protein
MNIITNKSRKLFYKKYLYKITFDFVLSNSFRTCNQKTSNLEYAANAIASFEEKLKRQTFAITGYYHKARIFPEDIEDAKLVRNTLLKMTDYMVRSEYNHNISIYCNDKDMLLKELKKLKNTDTVKVSGPDQNQIADLTSDQNVLVSKKAKDYSHKVTIDLYRLRPSNSELMKWISANRNKIKISDYALHQATSYVSVYVRDEKVLLLFRMAGDQYIKKVEKLILPV